jgi:hypothetical protein
MANLLQPLLYIVLLLLIINALNTQHDLIIVLGHPVNQGEACLWWKFIDRTHVVALCGLLSLLLRHANNFVFINIYCLLCSVFSKRWLVYAAGTNTDVSARNYLYTVFLLTKTQPHDGPIVNVCTDCSINQSFVIWLIPFSANWSFILVSKSSVVSPYIY